MQLKTTSSLALAFALAFGSGAVFAQDMSKTGKPLTAQQERMVACNKEATGKTGAERKTFMGACLKGNHMAAAGATPAAAGNATQQEKMKSCNADAKTQALKGAARKTFMSSCLKGNGAAAASAPAASMTARSQKATQQEKMKTCSADAKAQSLAGAARKTFMSTCLKGDGVTAH